MRARLAVLAMSSLLVSLVVIAIGGRGQQGRAYAAESGTAPSLATSISAGPIGTVVGLTGNVGGACLGMSDVNPTFTRQAYPPLSANVALSVPVGSNGEWAASFTVPERLAGGATYQGSNVTPGTYVFEVDDSCAPGGHLIRSFTVSGGLAAQPDGRFVAIARTANGRGYWLSQTGGGVYSFGQANFYGSLPGLGIRPRSPVTDMAASPTGGGYWLVSEDGGVFGFGDAGFHGSLPGIGLVPASPIISIAATPDGQGYWLLGADGGVFAFGDASYSGSSGSGSDSDIAPGSGTASYWMLDVDGHVTSFGAAQQFTDSQGHAEYAGPFVALFSDMASTPSKGGQWLVGTDGGVFAVGDAAFQGSLPAAGIIPAGPIVGIASTPDGGGYWLLGADGGVFGLGNAPFYGSAAGCCTWSATG